MKKTLPIFLASALIVIIALVMLDYSGFLKIGLFKNNQYLGRVDYLSYAFDYSRKLEIQGEDNFLQITRPEYQGENRPLIQIAFYKNGEFNDTEPFDNLLDWYTDYNYGNIEGREIQEIGWLDAKALKVEYSFDSGNDIIKSTFNYAFSPDKSYVVGIIYDSPSKFSGALESEYKEIVESFKFIK